MESCQNLPTAQEGKQEKCGEFPTNILAIRNFKNTGDGRAQTN